MISSPDWLKNYDLLTFETVDSTNTEALRLVKKGVRGNFVVLARQQTGGRGRSSKEWISADGNLYATILLESKLAISVCPQLSFLIANAIYDSIEFFASRQHKSLKIELKWPNDILINGKKIAGILLESINIQGKNNIVIGIGVNIAQTPAILQDQASSLYDEGIKFSNSEEFLNVLVNNFDLLYKEWCASQNFTKIRENWMKHAYSLGQVVSIDNGVQRVSGIFKDIAMDGAIRLQLTSGEIQAFVSGSLTS
jgi:BirA family biotin operon repressor/biotin-[acetyl-CoA-carboxylase] ligase